MSIRKTTTHARLMCGVAAAVIIACAGVAHAEDAPTINIAPQSLATALYEFGGQTGHQVLFTPDLAAAKTTRGVSGATDQQLALAQLLDGTGLTFQRSGDTFLITRADAPQSGSAAGDGADAGTVAALVVTAQKKEENIQDVPIAISAFTEKSLQEQKIEGGFDLLKAIPNVTFSKNNFSSYNFSIRGIGTKAVSVTTDPGVAVAFNNTALIRNRLFEQEYFDVERVEVLRGPQGTLYGRNATAGVINVISAKPDMQDFKGWLKGEVGNYHAKRLSAMVNVPLVDDKLAIRFAGALTDRAGYDYNTVTKHQINGRDLWSGRITIGFNPTEHIRSNFIWERFNEDDDRSRTGKQLCHRDDGIASIAGVDLAPIDAAKMSQGCKPGSLYDAGAFGTPNGFAIPFIQYMSGSTSPGPVISLVRPVDPYGGLMQSPDLRTIASIMDPRYRAKADIFELNVDVDIGSHLVASSQTAYNTDSIYSTQDYNRFNSFPVFRNTSDPTDVPFVFGDRGWDCGVIVASRCVDYRNFAPGGYFNDPQLGRSNTIAGMDISRARSRQFSQELRLQSDFDGPIDFNLGANYVRYNTEEDYFVLFNLVTAAAEVLNVAADPYTCHQGLVLPNKPIGSSIDTPYCIYIDPNPLDSISGEGHNYFRSENLYRMQSAAAFGELYWQAAPTLKVTAGVRYTKDDKKFTPIPSQLLLSTNLLWGGSVDRGYPSEPAIHQTWGKFTGRLGLDWHPDVAFGDAMLYAFYSRGYKGGGANPPGVGFRKEPLVGVLPFPVPPLLHTLPYPDTYKPEFVNAFEVGSKNTLLGGALALNGDVFFYDYKDYQVSQIKDRTAVNENFDAKVWGLELETLLTPARDLRFNASLGYQDSAIANGEASIDLMNRTQNNSDWVLLKPWVQLPSNCIAPREIVEAFVVNDAIYGNYGNILALCPGNWFAMGPGGWPVPRTEAYGYHIDQSTWPNGSAGFDADLGGNKLPNAPHWTVSLGAQYGHDIFDGSWRATVRADAYWQSQSWARVYNDNPYDKLHGWYNVNLSAWIERPEDDLKIEFYAKNLLDKTPITDAFLNSDDTGLTTNVFVLDPRLIGLSIKKGF